MLEERMVRGAWHTSCRRLEIELALLLDSSSQFAGELRSSLPGDASAGRPRDDRGSNLRSGASICR
jgi:hypothetical protein